jgi:hypothetical protein
MKSADEKAFAITLAGTLQVVYEKTVTPALLDVWFASLQQYELVDVQAAFRSYVTHPTDCKFPPKPGDIIRHLPTAATDDGHPGPDEAWGLLLRLVNDERETGVLTEEMRAGWEACQPILDLGDEVGARMCFLDVYRRRIQDARQSGRRAHWTVTLGTDPTLRVQRLNEAVTARRIGMDQARSLLPGPTPTSIDHVAGLLEGPDASPQDLTTSQRLRDLAQMLRDLRVESDRRWAEQRQQQRESAAEQQRQALAAAEAELLKRELPTVPNDRQKAA